MKLIYKYFLSLFFVSSIFAEEIVLKKQDALTESINENIKSEDFYLKDEHFNISIPQENVYARIGAARVLLFNKYETGTSLNIGYLTKKDYIGYDISISSIFANKSLTGVDLKLKNQSGEINNFQGEIHRNRLSLSLPKFQVLAFLPQEKPTNHNVYLGVGGGFTINYLRDTEKVFDQNGLLFQEDIERCDLNASFHSSVGYVYLLGKKVQSSMQFSVNIPTFLYRVVINDRAGTFNTYEFNVGIGF